MQHLQRDILQRKEEQQALEARWWVGGCCKALCVPPVTRIISHTLRPRRCRQAHNAEQARKQALADNASTKKKKRPPPPPPETAALGEGEAPA